jgi:hypothetical protein
MTEMTVVVEWRKGETSIYSFRSFGSITFKKICEHLEKNMGFDPEFDTVSVSGKASIITLEA